MAYYVYENWQAGPHKARIHAGDCVFCNNGMGTAGGSADPNHGKWHGPFQTRTQARANAASLKGVIDSRDCHACTAR
jgi:hypothetical protein